ncbi:MAG: 5-bromo-4-chloroindolyl phosphate hydrolysis family protein [Oscillospiraceae bacterium]|nr:5-bromo-4-chloroindolyl phosphate hydrolysis family protein [Oscillospiraceae bacterium]
MTNVKNAKADKTTAVGILQIFLGGVLILASLIIALIGAAWSFIFDVTGSTTAIITLACLVSGILLIWRGGMNYKLANRFRRAYVAMGENTVIKLSVLEQKLDLNRDKLVKSLRLQISRRYWTETFLDEENGVLVRGYNPTHLKSESNNQAISEILNKANGYIHEMVTINRVIDDEDLKVQVDTLASLSKQIYEYIDKNQEKVSQVRQLTNYFLPTTVELLTTYRELQEQTVKSDNMANSMQEIKDMMATIESAFRKQLDAIYGDKVLDASVEIEVMKGIMKDG